MAKNLTPAMQKQEKKLKGGKKIRTGPWIDAWKRLLRNKAAMVSLGIIFIFVL